VVKRVLDVQRRKTVLGNVLNVAFGIVRQVSNDIDHWHWIFPTATS